MQSIGKVRVTKNLLDLLSWCQLYSAEAQAGSAFKLKATGVEHNFKSCVGGLDVLFLKE
jgi:hypothetical protein